MTTASHQILQVLEHIVKTAPLGTNLALLQLMWTILNGAFLRSRGAVHTALLEADFEPEEVRRGWQALRYGVWSSEELLARWRQWVRIETVWQANEYEGWRPLAIDITTFRRPHLQGWLGRGYHQLAQRLLPGVSFAIIVQVGYVASQRVPLLRKLNRAGEGAETETALKEAMLAWVRRHLALDEAAICDAGVKISQMQAAGVPRYVLRRGRNYTVRCNVLMVSIYAPIARFRGAKGVEREQLKWFVYFGVLMLLMFPLAFVAGEVVGNIFIAMTILILPMATAVAILRYRLYDIDVIIRKTLVYAVLTGVLALVCFGMVVLLQGVIGSLTGAEQSPGVIVVSTLLIAALFTPLRRQVQELIDRRFYRRKYIAEQVLARFGQYARDEVQLERLTAELVQVVQETMQPETATLWLKSSASPNGLRGRPSAHFKSG